MLHIDPYNPRAQKLHDELDEYVDFTKIPIHVVFGGDGYMLKIIRKYGHYAPRMIRKYVLPL